MSDAARKLADWCDEVEQQHEPMSDPADGSVCGQCGWGFPCHAIQGTRAVRAALEMSTRPLSGIAHALVSMAAALKEK
jgi:hypothetical protein